MTRELIKFLLKNGFKAMIGNDPGTGWLRNDSKNMSALIHLEEGICLIIIDGWKKEYYSLPTLKKALGNDFIEDRRKDKIKLILDEV